MEIKSIVEVSSRCAVIWRKRENKALELVDAKVTRSWLQLQIEKDSEGLV